MGGCKIIMLTSCKGGVGKSTITANLAATLASIGKKTMMIDCDFGMRCLDLIAGLEDRALYDITDIISERVEMDKAVVYDGRSEFLYFVAAPYRYRGHITEKAFRRTIDALVKKYELDYLFIDTHAGMSDGTELAAAAAQTAVVVATHQIASIRAAEQTAILLAEKGVTDMRLIINCFDDVSVKHGKLPGVIETIDRTTVRLLGIIPYSTNVIIAQRKGLLVTEYESGNLGIAYDNIAARLEGETLPLLSGFRRTDRRVVRI